MAYFVDRVRVFQPATIRLTFLIVGVFTFLFTELFRQRLRPIIRAMEINDWGFSDTIGNSGGILVQIFLSLAIINPTRTQSFQLDAFFSAGYIFYEFAQPYLPKGTFDWKDVLATLNGYFIAVVLLVYLWRMDDKRSTQIPFKADG